MTRHHHDLHCRDRYSWRGNLDYHDELLVQLSSVIALEETTIDVATDHGRRGLAPSRSCTRTTTIDRRFGACGVRVDCALVERVRDLISRFIVHVARLEPQIGAVTSPTNTLNHGAVVACGVGGNNHDLDTDLIGHAGRERDRPLVPASSYRCFEPPSDAEPRETLNSWRACLAYPPRARERLREAPAAATQEPATASSARLRSA